MWLGAAALLVPVAGGAQDAAPRLAGNAKVSAVRFWSLGDVTRIAVEVSSDFTFKYSRLSNPERLAFDIQGASPAMVTRGVHTIRVGDGLLDQIRVAEKEPGITRIVLDLPHPAEMTRSQLTNPSRLVIELRSNSKDAPPLSGAPLLSALPPMKPAPVAAAPERTLGIYEIDSEVRRKPTRTFVPPATEPKPPVRLASILGPAIKLSSAKLNVAGTDVLPAPDAVPALPPPAPAVPLARPLATPLPVAPPPVAMAPLLRTVATSTRTSEVLEPQAAKRSAISGDRSLTRALGLKLGRVVLDPGHGGHDQGTHGPSGYLEKDLSLDVALRLGELIHEQLGSEVVYTRTADTFVGLEERTRIANEHRADLFLSIHANSSAYRAAAGTETYVLNFTTSKTAMDLASRENASSQRSIFDLQELVQQITLKDKVDESREFAVRLQTSLATLSGRSNERAKDRGVKRAPFVVLIGATMPSVLAEIGFLSNTTDEKLLRSPEHRQKIAEALYKGISSYAATLSHFQVAGKPATDETARGIARR